MPSPPRECRNVARKTVSFQRLISAARDMVSQGELVSLFSYELSTHPPSTFDTHCLIRAANNQHLTDATLNTVGTHSTLLQDINTQYVLDFGSLFQSIPCTREVSRKQYFCNIVILF